MVAVPQGGKLKYWLDNLADWLDSPMGGLAAFGLTLAIRGIWPRLSAAARKRVQPTRKKGAKHHNHKHPRPSNTEPEPGVAL